MRGLRPPAHTGPARDHAGGPSRGPVGAVTAAINRAVTTVVDAASALPRLLRSGPARRAVRRRAAALGVALALALWVQHQHADARRLRARWDATTAVLVTARPVRSGAVPGPGDLTIERRPAALVPAGALTERPADRRRAVVDLPAGEVVLDDRLRAGGTVASRVPAGRSAVTLRVEGGLPPVELGDRVDVFAPPGQAGGSPPPDEMSGGTGAAGTRAPGAQGPGDQVPGDQAVATAAIVVDAPARAPVGGGSLDDTGRATLTVAVDDGDIAATTAAVMAGPVAVVLRAPGP
jgi:hypothetical protein